MITRCILAALVAASFATTIPAATGPEQAMEARALGLVEALASGNEQVALDYLRENLTPEKFEQRSVEDWRGLVGMLMGDLGSAEVDGVAVEGPARVDVVVRTGRGTMTFGFDFETKAPHRIEGLAVDLRAGGGDDAPASDLPSPPLRPGMSHDEIAGALGAWFGDLAKRELFSGTALVARDGEAIFSTAHGLASRRFGVPNRLDTRFDLGSINKTFTKIAIGRLMSEGKLTLEDTIADHLPDYPNAEVAGKVSLGQLIEHTSGLGDIFTEEFFAASKAGFREPRDYFPLFAGDDLLFEPGTSRRYSNGGYMVLGAIVEAVSGLPYDAYVTRHVFEPAGMRDTGFFAHDEPVPNVAIGYTRRGFDGGPGDGTIRNNLYMLSVKGSPAGSAFSTVEDLLRFDNAVRNHRLLPPAYTAWLFGGPVPRAGQAREAAAAGRLEVAAGMAGGAPGVSAVMEIDGDLLIVILCNVDEPAAEEIARALRRPLRRAVR